MVDDEHASKDGADPHHGRLDFFGWIMVGSGLLLGWVLGSMIGERLGGVAGWWLGSGLGMGLLGGLGNYLLMRIRPQGGSPAAAIGVVLGLSFLGMGGFLGANLGGQLGGLIGFLLTIFLPVWTGTAIRRLNAWFEPENVYSVTSPTVKRDC